MDEKMQTGTMVNNYDEAVKLIEELGILPLASLIPDYPSLESVTPQTSWHSDTEQDPWKWRVRFPAEGKAAYGKFMKKKAVLVSPDWFPLVFNALRLGPSAEACYRDGLLSQAAWELYLAHRNRAGDRYPGAARAGVHEGEGRQKSFRPGGRGAAGRLVHCHLRRTSESECGRGEKRVEQHRL